MNKFFIIILLNVVLIGCSTVAQQQATTIRTGFQKAAKELLACRARIYNQPEYDSIRDKLLSPANNMQPTIAQLADDEIPTDQDSELLVKYHDESLPCRTSALDKLYNLAPPIAYAIADGLVKVDDIELQLVQQKISWGEADKLTLKWGTVMRQNVKIAIQEMDRNLALSDQAERQQWQANTNTALMFSGALMQWSVDMAAIKAANQPVYTNCTEGGPYINCVSKQQVDHETVELF